MESKWENLEILLKTHQLYTFSYASYFELQTPFHLLKSQKTLNYWACIQLFIILCGFEIITDLVLRIFKLSSDVIIGVYCMS